MKVCHEAANEFFEWMSNYRYREYADIGEALVAWLENDNGSVSVGDNYSVFLQTVIVVIDPKRITRFINKDKESGKEKIGARILEWPPESVWLDKIDPDVFDRVVSRNRDKMMYLHARDRNNP